MRNLLMMLLWFITSVASATDYYVSSTGNDSSTGLSSSTPWKTISKVISSFSSLKPGDKILFKRGETFFGSLAIEASGSSGNPITIGAYGTGSNPVITGFTTITGWNKYSNGIYYRALTCESAPNIVSINGVNTAMGRWPNAGEYMTLDSHYSNTSIYDAELPSSLNWTGAEVIIRKNKYIWDRNTISNHSGTTICYISGSNYSPEDGFGYFIQNSLATLDKTGEWYYDGTNFYMYFGSANPSSYNVKVSSLDQLAYLDGDNYITFDNLSFEGANVYAIQIRGADYTTIQNCSISFTGRNAIFGPWWGTSPHCKISNNTITNSNNNAIVLWGDHTYASITNNSIRNTGLLVGMGVSGDGTYTGITVNGDNSLVQYNTIENSGYVAISFAGDNTTVSNNLIDGFNLVKNDGGGIYTYVGTGTWYTGLKVTGNIVLNGTGYNGGCPDQDLDAAGIYLDDRSRNVTVTGNTIAGCNSTGIFLHNAHEIRLENNTLYNNGTGRSDFGCQILFVHDNYSPDDPVRNINMNHNIFFAKTLLQGIMSFSTISNDIPSFGSSDYNCYAKPIDNTYVARTWGGGWYSTLSSRTLTNWKSFTNQDYNSYQSPISLTDVNKIRLEYNASTSNKSVILDDSYVDVNGTKYSGTLTLLPYSSVILMVDPNSSAIETPPVYVSSIIENANPDKLIITCSASLSSTVPSASDFTVMVNSTGRTVNSVTVSGTKVIIVLASSVVYGDVVTVAYTKPATNPLQTTAGVQAASFTAKVVVNRVGITNVAPVPVVDYEPISYSGFVSELDATDSYDANNDKLTFTWDIPSDIPASSTTGPLVDYLNPIVTSIRKVEFKVNICDGKTILTKSIPVEILPYRPDLVSAEIVTVEASSFQAPYYPNNIIDGDSGTMWSANGTSQWIILELKEPMNVQHVRLAFLSGEKRQSYFDILGSINKKAWDPVLAKEASCAFSSDVQVFDFPPSKTERKFKYLKLLFETNSVDTCNYISEFKVYGNRYKYDSEYEEQPVKIYPNPAHKYFNVKIEDTSITFNFIKILSLAGTIMYHDDNIESGITDLKVPINLKKGIYLIQLGSDNATLFSQKLIITN